MVRDGQERWTVGNVYAVDGQWSETFHVSVSKLKLKVGFSGVTNKKEVLV